ncbi:MAG: FAD-linked oxidase C-terminal domain-containing protein [Pseudomonadota bacterium]
MTINAAISELASLLGERLTTSKSDRDIHGRSEVYYQPMPPDAVAYPETTEEVSALVEICARHDCPVVPWGTGTSLEGHALAAKGGVTVDFQRMNAVLQINDEDMDVRVQPGITRIALNEELRATGLFFSVDPGANASIGGMASTRASGTTTVRYGTMAQNVMGLEVVLADGRIIRTGSRARKTSAGYDLTQLFVGSEGTLGLITELTLKLQGQPEAVSAGICAFPDMHSAVNCVMTTIQMGLPMARIEFVDAATAQAFNTYSGTDTFPALPHLLVEFHGSEAAVAEQAERFGELVEDYGGSGFKSATRAEERNALWKLRHDGYYAILQAFKGYTAMSTDICVPISQLADAVTQAQKDIADSPLDGPILGHVGDGNFHAILMIDPDKPEDLREAKRLADRMVERALDAGGTVTGEHGVGMGKMKYMTREHGDAWSVMADIKRSFDPQNILNPGKMVQIN